ncbi:DUF7409 domain-containing protein [Haloarchaeobius salinus]|uniref:DUF7409 domain-containing protein n=1 Tax=Haloarchaeobius salinus TaxID=1198298 RepID=UPI00210C7E70|nr:hypothetical protein [Haloarchaeobius salinus]
MGTNDGGEELVADAETLAGLDGVTPVAAAQLTDAGVTASDVAEKRVTYTDLVEAGVEQGVATDLRREYSLSWSSTLGDGLDERAESMGGLHDDERDWVAASTSDWEELGVREYDPVEREPVDVWADRERPTPVETVVDGWVADQLADAGITSVRQLAWVDAAALANALEVNVMQARTWRFSAREAFQRE